VRRRPSNKGCRRLAVRSSSLGSALKDVTTLRAAVAAGRRISLYFFWGHRAPAGVRVGKWCLSQWWPAPFEVDGHAFATAEHFMMAEKARLFGDRNAEAEILGSSDPAEAKAIGRRVRGFEERTWAVHRVGAVVRGNQAKFQQYPELGGFLVSIVDDVIAEASPADAVWGIGLRETDPAARDPRRWPGTNLLGFALMQVRQELRGLGTEQP
jgi:ribA/ribD-fused uncharacterized protein